MIKICPDCCNIDIDKLEKYDVEIEEDCIGLCGTEYVAFVNEELIEAESEEEFFEKLDKAL